MKIFSSIFTLSISLLLIHCTKQTQKITETVGETTGEIVSNSVDSILITDTVSVFQKNIKKIEENGEAIAIYANDEKTVKATFKSGNKGKPVVVLSENEKDGPSLSQSSINDSVAVYKAKSTEFTVKGNGAVLKENGQIYTLTAK